MADPYLAHWLLKHIEEVGIEHWPEELVASRERYVKIGVIEFVAQVTRDKPVTEEQPHHS